MGISRGQVYASVALAGRVERYHTWPTLHRQTVAEHSWRMAAIFVEVFGLPRAEVLYYIQHHDCGELYCGDLPYRSDTDPELKRLLREAEVRGRQRLGVELPQLVGEEPHQVKICDYLEMWEFGQLETRLGNRFAEPVVLAMRQAAEKYAEEHLLLTQTYSWLEKQTYNWSEKSR